MEGYFAHYYGGVNAFTSEQFLKINGFSNDYFGWGAEGLNLISNPISFSFIIGRIQLVLKPIV